MPERSDLDRRLRAVERALTDGDHDVADLAATGDLADRVGAVEDRLDDIEERLDELDAATQAVRGYVGNVRAVNDEVEQRADAALAAVDRLERRLDERSTAQSGRENDEHRHRDASPTTGTNEPRYGTDASARDGYDGGSPGGPAGSPRGSIEMRPSGEATDDAGEEDRSVIDRVREAL